MLPSLIIHGILYLGLLIVRLVYGKAGYEAAEMLNKDCKGEAGLITFGGFLWLAGSVSMATTLPTGWKYFGVPMVMLGVLAGIWIVSGPALFVTWVVVAKKVIVPRLIEKAKPILEGLEAAEKKLKENPNIEEAERVKKNGWVCSCGREHPAYDMDCACGKTKLDAKKAALAKKEAEATSTGEAAK